MAEVFLNVRGDGYATCDAIPPMVEGESFTIRFYPDAGATLDAVRAYDSHDYAVALPPVVNNELTTTFRSAWGNLYVDIYFSGSPTPPTPAGSFIWLWLKIAKLKRKRRKLT